MEKLISKPCRICGDPVTPTQRTDRKGNRRGFHYPHQCEKCFGVCRDPEQRFLRKSAKLKGMNHPLALPLFAERIRKNTDGYDYAYIKIAPSGPWPAKHRWVMEQHLGRKLERGEIVHHIDGNTLNNELSNLRLMGTICHSQLHNVINTWSEDHACCISCGTTERPHKGHGLCRNCWTSKYLRENRGKPKIKWSRKHDRCLSCGTTETPHQGHGLCENCAARQYRASR